MKPIGPIFELASPNRRVRAEVAVETMWIGATVYPECPVWRVWYDGRLVVDTSALGLLPKKGLPLAYAMTLARGTRHRAQTGIGPARAAKLRFLGRDGRGLEALVRVTDQSAFCTLRQPRKRIQDGIDLSVTRFPEGSVLLENTGTLNVQREPPQVRFAPSGKLIAFWRHGLEQHIVFFDRPGDLAERRFAAMESVEELVVADGRQGCGHLFLTVPFTRNPLPAPVFGDAVTPAYRAAFGLMLGSDGAGDDFWVMRGEPGSFAVAALRQGGVWRVAGVTAEARTLTVRFEDVWLRTPPELRARRYTAEILRDPLKGEAGDRVEESFAEQAPDVRVALDLAENGGFLITFRP
ncbi:MAG: glycoside hydrolase family 97 C-terminal domain-containing protein [Kiritimatiellae bacterium]|nr:glycoside hydrolase family 97 C-terminal domain-containing protein [Kiritimatiellia bacterium]